MRKQSLPWSDFSKVITVYKHLSRVHGKSEVDARKMRKKIRGTYFMALKPYFPLPTWQN
jgi:hypothetical protein